MRRFVLLAGFLAVAVIGGAGCSRPSQPVGGAAGAKAEQARKQAEGLAVNGVSGAAKVQAKLDALAGFSKGNNNNWLTKLVAASSWAASSQAIVNRATTPPPAPKANPQPPPPAPAARPARRLDASPVVIREKVIASLPASAEADAENDTLLVAQETLERRFAELDPPIRYKPSLNEVKNEFLRGNSRKVFAPEPAELAEYTKNGLGPNLVFVELEIEVNTNQVRELRTGDRLGDGLRILGGLAAVVMAGFMFLRLDERTKGNRTHALAIMAVALATGAAVALYLV